MWGCWLAGKEKKLWGPDYCPSINLTWVCFGKAKVVQQVYEAKSTKILDSLGYFVEIPKDLFESANRKSKVEHTSFEFFGPTPAMLTVRNVVFVADLA